MRVAVDIVLTREEREVLEKLTRSRRTSVRLSQRARMVLLASTGMENHENADDAGVGRAQAWRWRQRYAQRRLAGISAICRAARQRAQ